MADGFDNHGTDEAAHDLPPGVDERWGIDDEETAAWALARLRDAEARPDRAVKAAEAYVEREVKEAERDAAFFREHLAAWYAAHPPRKGKTLWMPSGGFQAVDVAERLEMSDPSKTLAWAEERCPGLVTRPEPKTPPPKVYLDDVKAWIAGHPDEPLPPGVRVVPARVDYRAKAPKGDEG